MLTKLGNKIVVKGRSVEVWITDTGLFRTRDEHGETLLEAPTLDELKKLVSKEVSKKKVAIPVTIFDENRNHYRGPGDPSFKNATLTGKHSSNKNPLLRYENGSSEQFSSYGSKILVRVSDEEQQAFLGLFSAQQAADRAVREWLDEHKLDVNAALKEAGVQ